MMLKEKSSPWARLKYLYVLPLAAIAVTAFARPEVSDKVKEISAVKVNDLTAIVETKVQETVPKVVNDTVKTTGKVVTVVGWKKNAEKGAVEVSGNGETKVTMIRSSSHDSKDKPLVIVDGKEIDYSLMNVLNPAQISSMSVLKDKSATSLYGDKGKNGVIIITTMTEDEFQQKQKSAKQVYHFDITTQEDGNGLKVAGKVQDKDGKPIVGATVLVKGTTVGAVADADGTFIFVAPKDAVLTVSYINKRTAEVKVSSSPIIVTLKDE